MCVYTTPLASEAFRIRPDSHDDRIKNAPPESAPVTDPSRPAGMKKVYGRAFLIHLHRGDVELATVFAKAFLLSENGPENNNDYC